MDNNAARFKDCSPCPDTSTIHYFNLKMVNFIGKWIHSIVTVQIPPEIHHFCVKKWSFTLV